MTDTSAKYTLSNGALRPIWGASYIRRRTRDQRSFERIGHHYEFERKLAARLRNAPKHERAGLYGEVYAELFRRIEDHPQHNFRDDNRQDHLRRQYAILKRFLSPQAVVMEVGAGDCRLARMMAQQARHVYAVDVTEEQQSGEPLADNMSFVLSRGTDLPVPPESVSLAISDQLMEHIHPEDAVEQLRNIYAALKPGGLYLCSTPSRVSGPHDVSSYFELEANGFHLKEYTYRELMALFREVGFREQRALIAGGGYYFGAIPARFAAGIERVLDLTPSVLRPFALRNPITALFLGVIMVVRK